MSYLTDQTPGSGSAARLPRWIGATVGASGLLAQLLHGVDLQLRAAQEEVDRLLPARYLDTLPLGEPYREWVVPAPYREEPLQVVVQTSSLTREIRPAATPADYSLASDPVWWWDRGSGQLRLRNLATKETAASGPGGVYTISGEPGGFLPDQDTYYREADAPDWLRLPCEGITASGATFTLPLSGTLHVRYPSAQLLAELTSGTVQLRRPGGDGPQLPLQLVPQPNLWDGYGHLLGISRLPGEGNAEYRTRLFLAARIPGDTTVGGFLRQVALRLGQLTAYTWDGVTPLALDPDGTGDLTSVWVVGVPRGRTVQEELLPDPDHPGRYYADWGDWADGAIVRVDGLPVPGWTLSGTWVLVDPAPSGRVSAEYSVVQWSAPAVGTSYPTLEPGAGLPSGSYLVLTTRGVQATPLDLEEVFNRRLLDAEGLPTALYRELAHLLAAGNPTTWGRARWGQGVWFRETEDRPATSRLLLAFDG